MGTPYAVSSDLVSAYPAKSLAIAQYIDGYKLDTGPVQNAQTGTSYTFALTDTTKTVTASNAAASTYTVPPQSSVVWEDYTTLRILNLGTGVVTLTAGAGVTLNGTATLSQYSSATLVRTASNAWTITGNGTAPGMVLITPTSVAGTGVTLSGGEVSFSAATTVSVNGCFTSAYDVYRVFIYGSSSPAGAGAGIRMRASGTDNSTASSYIRELLRGLGAAAAAVNSTDSQWSTMASFDSDIGATTLDFYKPAIAAMTGVLGSCMGYGNTTMDYAVLFGGRHNQSVAYDGFTLLPASGNVTGKIRIYGLRNS